MERGHAGGNLPGGGEGREGSGDHGFDLAVCAGHLTGWQGVLAPPSIAPSPSAACSQGAPPRIQNNSGPPQGPATGLVVGWGGGAPTAAGQARGPRIPQC